MVSSMNYKVSSCEMNKLHSKSPAMKFKKGITRIRPSEPSNKKNRHNQVSKKCLCFLPNERSPYLHWQ
jgi:hypothetical protein